MKHELAPSPAFAGAGDIAFKPRCVSLRSRSPGLALACALVFLVACRFEREQTEWVETHGEWQFQSLSAWPEGAWAVGLDDRVFRYPGEWGEPWNRALPVTGKLVAASPSAAFVLGSDKVVRRVRAGQVFEFPGSREWHVTAMAAGPDDAFYVVADGRVKKVTASLEPAACDEAATSVAVGGPAVYWTTPAGALRRQEADGACADVPLPEDHRAHHVAAFHERLAVVDSHGRGLLRNQAGEPWIALPAPRLYRSAEPVRVFTLRQLAVSQLYTWALDSEGHAFLLAEAQ